MDGETLLLSVIRDISDRKRTEDDLAHATERLRRTLKAAVVALGATTELRDPYTAGHQRRVAQLACAIAAELGWDEAASRRCAPPPSCTTSARSSCRPRSSVSRAS